MNQSVRGDACGRPYRRGRSSPRDHRPALTVKQVQQMDLHAQFVGRPFSFLDLGCGDAATLAPLLASMAVQRYKGVDLSESALALAAENLTGLSCPVKLVCLKNWKPDYLRA